MERTRTIAKWRRYNPVLVDALFHSLQRFLSTPTRAPALKSLPLTDQQFKIAVGVVAVILVLVVIRIRFCYELELPDAPAGPEAMSNIEALETTRSLEFSPATYEQHLKDDSKAHGIKPVATIESMSRVFPYQRQVVDKRIVPGDPAIAAAGLRLRLITQNITGTHKRQMVLEIENPGARPLAYRIETAPSKGTQPCHSKRNITHNAMAIAPRTTELRSECVYRDGWGVKIQSVETIQLPELSYLYVSWLRPERLGMDRRTGGGHQAVGAPKPCDLTLAANIQQGLETGEISWRDAIDFYARHSCRTYSFPYGYRAFDRDSAYELPVGPESY